MPTAWPSAGTSLSLRVADDVRFVEVEVEVEVDGDEYELELKWSLGRAASPAGAAADGEATERPGKRKSRPG